MSTQIVDNTQFDNDPKKYVMNEGNYLILVRILEGSDLIPSGTNSYLNPFVVVTVRDKVKRTKACKKTLSPLWDQSFTFEFGDLKKSDLQSTIITIELFDEQYFILKESVAKYEIDLSSVYYEKYHQYYRAWFTLVDPEDKKEGLMGYILMNIDVLGPGDRLHVNEKITEDSVSQTVVSRKIPQIGYLIIAELFRAEHLAPMNITKRSIEAKVKINYGGVSVSSSIQDDSNPTWNEILYLQAMLPNHSKNLQIELWNTNAVMNDDLIGTCLIPLNCFHLITDLPPTWVNIYGPPLCGTSNEAKEMAEHGYSKGSSYRGRVLMRFSSVHHENPKSRMVKMLFKVPEMLNPNPPVRAYFLRIEIYTGQELPGSEGLLHFSIGPYFKKTKLMKSNQGIFDWGKECVEFNRLMLPIDASQIPDLFIYFADADYESHRKCYFRLKTHMILNRSRKQYAKKFERPVLVKFKEDISLDLVPDDQFSGFVILRPVLFSYEPIEREKPEVSQYGLQHDKAKSTIHELRMFFYVGRDLPTASESGTCNPLIVIRVADKVIYSRIKRNTINPEWYHVETVKIHAPNSNDKGAPPLAIVVMLFHVDDPDVLPKKYFETDIDQMNEKNDDDESENKGMFSTFIPKKKVLLGRYWLELDLNKKKIYKNPKTGKE